MKLIIYYLLNVVLTQCYCKMSRKTPAPALLAVINDYWCWRGSHCHHDGENVCAREKRTDERRMFKCECTVYKFNCSYKRDFTVTDDKYCKKLKRRSFPLAGTYSVNLAQLNLYYIMKEANYSIIVLVLVLSLSELDGRKKKFLGIDGLYAEYYCRRLKSCVENGVSVCGFDNNYSMLAVFEDLCTLYRVNCKKYGKFEKVDMVVCDTQKSYQAKHTLNDTFEFVHMTDKLLLRDATV